MSEANRQSARQVTAVQVLMVLCVTAVAICAIWLSDRQSQRNAETLREKPVKIWERDK